MIDIHSHVLWGLDDGAGTQEESAAMLEMAFAFGTTDLVVTPHANSEYPFDWELVGEKIANLAKLENIPRLHRGCDFHMSFENIQDALRAPSKYTINGLNYLLVEFADSFIPPATEEIFRQFMALGIVPIVTHPERNPILSRSMVRLEKWASMGCLIQVTAQSLTDRFGKSAQDAAWGLLRKGLVHAIASDAHDTVHRPPRLNQAHELLTEQLGEDVANLLLVENPSAVITGGKVWQQAPASAPRKKKWFFFG
jgi:protein-tyrosine phosphatase